MGKDKLNQPVKKLKRPNILVIFGLLFLISFALVYFNSSENGSQSTVDTEIITYSTDEPSETKPSTLFNWRGNANDPKKIVIESVGIEGFVQNVGIDQNNQIAVPNNVHKAGWFVDTVRPGEKGLSIIDGHIDGRTSNDAIFKNLPNVSVGDEVKIMFGDNSIKVFSIVSKTEAPTNEIAEVLYSQIPGINSQLNLITCVGSYKQDQGGYDKRLVVSLKSIE